jgi:hypothetical protein
LRILAENSEGRLISVIGENGARKYLELTKSRFVDEYDVDIVEAPLTIAQRAETAQTMIAFAEKAASLGKNIYSLVIDYIPNLKASDKQKLKEALQPSPQEEQAAAQQAQIQLEEARISADISKSVAESQRAKAMRDTAEAEAKIAAFPLEAQKLKAETDRLLADTAEKLTKSEQIVVETELARYAPKVSVTI